MVQDWYKTCTKPLVEVKRRTSCDKFHGGIGGPTLHSLQFHVTSAIADLAPLVMSPGSTVFDLGPSRKYVSSLDVFF